MNKTKLKLHELVLNFRNWLSENYSNQEITELLFDDAGYPNWNEIEDFFTELLDSKLIQKLDNEDQENLLYLISRNWDCGRMIAWLSKGDQLSNLGHLECDDFINLSKKLIKINNIEYDDAKSQFASSFKKIPYLNKDIEEVLLSYYNDKNEYTKRLALISLGYFGYSDIEKLIEISWNTVNDEHHKMGCLFVLYEYLKNKELLNYYLTLAENEEGENLKNYTSTIIKPNY